MKSLLKIQASLSGPAGLSTQLADRFAAQWLQQHPQGRVVTRDLAANALPHLSAERLQAFSTSPPERTAEQQAIVDDSDALIQELRDADVIVFGVPMYNFSVPSTLRAYFDHIARAGITFRYTDTGPEGLIRGKKAYVLIARGGVYADAADTQTPYLRQFLGFIGLTDVEFIYAEGLNISPTVREKGLNAAFQAIASIAPHAVAA